MTFQRYQFVVSRQAVCYIWLTTHYESLGVSGNFYVCQALQNVTEKAIKAQRNFRIRWLEINKAPNIFKTAYDDLLDPQTVIGEVSYDRFSLPIQSIQNCWNVFLFQFDAIII